MPRRTDHITRILPTLNALTRETLASSKSEPRLTERRPGEPINEYFGRRFAALAVEKATRLGEILEEIDGRRREIPVDVIAAALVRGASQSTSYNGLEQLTLQLASNVFNAQVAQSTYSATPKITLAGRLESGRVALFQRAPAGIKGTDLRDIHDDWLRIDDSTNGGPDAWQIFETTVPDGTCFTIEFVWIFAASAPPPSNIEDVKVCSNGVEWDSAAYMNRTKTDQIGTLFTYEVKSQGGRVALDIEVKHRDAMDREIAFFGTTDGTTAPVPPIDEVRLATSQSSPTPTWVPGDILAADIPGGAGIGERLEDLIKDLIGPLQELVFEYGLVELGSLDLAGDIVKATMGPRR